jgi:hypothetical protein
MSTSRAARRTARDFEEWKKFAARQAPEVWQTICAVEVFQPGVAKLIFTQAYAQGEQGAENEMAQDMRNRGE